MRRCLAALLVCLAVQPAAAQAKDVVAVPAKRQLMGIDAAEADALIARLEEAQRRLKAGKFQPFLLLAGSVASYDMTRTSPRQAFLDVKFARVWEIQRVDRPLRSYRLAYAPDGLGKKYWDIEVALEGGGELYRVAMTYQPPAPF